MNDLERRLRTGARAAGGPPPVTSAASHAGLVDVAYTTIDSPLGPLLLATTPKGLARVGYLRSVSEARLVDELAARHGPRVLRDPQPLERARRQLEAFFDRKQRQFDLALDLEAVTPFTRRVLDVAAAIPYGEVRTYTEVAAAAGSPRGARAAGGALGANPVPIVVPCHRVVRTGGDLGGYTGGLDLKEHLLRLERAPAA